MHAYVKLVFGLREPESFGFRDAHVASAQAACLCAVATKILPGRPDWVAGIGVRRPFCTALAPQVLSLLMPADDDVETWPEPGLGRQPHVVLFDS